MSSTLSTGGSPRRVEAIHFSHSISPRTEIRNDDDGLCGDASRPSNFKGDLPPSTQMANEILNDILETAMDIAIEGHPVLEENTKNPEGLRNIIDGLSKINVGNVSTPPMDMEMKRILNEMMTSSSQPQPIVNNLGIGDSPPIDQFEERRPLPVKPSKTVEKKSRITDLVMNSKKALNNLLNEEQRKKQDEWEESNEHVIQVIELQKLTQGKEPQPPENYPLPVDEEDLLKPQSMSKVDRMDSIELCVADAAAGNSLGGKGDERNVDGAGSTDMSKKSSLCSSGKRKKFQFLKFFSFRRNRKEGKEKGDKLVDTSQANCNAATH